MTNYLIILAINSAIILLLHYIFNTKNMIFMKLSFFGNFPERRRIKKDKDTITVFSLYGTKHPDLEQRWIFNIDKDSVERLEISEFGKNSFSEGTLQEGIDKNINRIGFYFFVFELIEEYKYIIAISIFLAATVAETMINIYLRS